MGLAFRSMEGGEDIVIKPPQPAETSGGPWSSFHSLQLPAAKLPGGPVRQYRTPALVLPVNTAINSAPRAPHVVEEVKQHFTDLDILLE